MKTLQVLGGWALGLCTLTGAFAAGDGTQGTYVCGAKLDTLVKGFPNGSCQTATGNPPRLTLADKTVVTLKSCNAENNMFRDCEGSFSKDNYCGVEANTSARLIVFKGTVSKGRFTFGGTKWTVTCEGRVRNSHHKPPEPPSCTPVVESFGTADDCMAWEYKPTDSQNKFDACIRMARADYCGSGWSNTRVGTHIEVWAPPEEACKCKECAECLEATWDASGAVCVYKQRWADIEARIKAVASLVGFNAKTCLDGFSQEITLPGGAKAICRAKVDPNSALLRSRSQIHTCANNVPTTTACGVKAGGYDPDCQTKCAKN